ncbi:hypothetical protein [Streptomyces atratus]
MSVTALLGANAVREDDADRADPCSLCGAAAELDPVLKGFDQGFGKN